MHSCSGFFQDAIWFGQGSDIFAFRVRAIAQVRFQAAWDNPMQAIGYLVKRGPKNMTSENHFLLTSACGWQRYLTCAGRRPWAREKYFPGVVYLVSTLPPRAHVFLALQPPTRDCFQAAWNLTCAMLRTQDSSLFSRFCYTSKLCNYSFVSSNKGTTQQNIHWAHVIDDRYVEIGWNQVSFVMIFRIGWADDTDSAVHVMRTCRRRKHCLLTIH